MFSKFGVVTSEKVNTVFLLLGVRLVAFLFSFFLLFHEMFTCLLLTVKKGWAEC